MVAIPPQTVQVVIVGAGLSGLRAATEIHDAGLDYVVLEAMDHVGGKTLSVPTTSNGSAQVDMGAAWINDSNQSEMYALAEKFGFDLIQQRTEGQSLYEDPLGGIQTLPYGMPAPLTDEQLDEYHNIMTKLGEYVERSNLENPHLGPDAKELDAMTALEFADKTFESDLAATLVTTLTRALLGVDADELSALYLVDYIKSGTGLANIMADTKDGGQYLRNRQGNQHFSTRLATQLDPKKLKLSTPVKSIKQSSQGAIVETNDGTRYHTEKVIVSVPTALYPTINFTPSLPAAKKTLGESTKLGYYSKTVLVFSEPWWRAANLSGVFTSDDGPISFTRDTVSEDDSQYSITCFHVGEPGREWSRLSAEDRRASVLEQFNEAFGSVVDEVPEPINILEKEWTKDPWALGGPSPVMMPGTMTSKAGQSIRESFGNIHFVGTETALVWKGYMEGAVRSGVRGAKEVIKACKSEQ